MTCKFNCDFCKGPMVVFETIDDCADHIVANHGVKREDLQTVSIAIRKRGQQ